MPKGIVVRYERNSGFGFIETEKGETVFVHHTSIVDPGRQYLVAGQQVEFRIEPSERGPRAEQVSVLREVPRKAERNLDWRHRRGGHPRAGEVPGRPAAPAEDLDAEEGILPGGPVKPPEAK